jgi:hypothetical protein
MPARDPFARIVKLAAKLPGAQPSTMFAAPVIRVRGKSLGNLRKDGAVFALCCAGVAEKELYLASEPDIFFQSDHLKGSSYCLVRLNKITDKRLFDALKASRRAKAGKRLLADYDGAMHKGASASARPKAIAPKRDHFARVRKLALKLPGVEEGASYGTRALRVGKKFLCRMKEDGETLALQTANLDEKEFLMESDPAAFYETDHYKGWPGVLIHLSRVDDKRLFALLEASWRRRAGKKMLTDYESGEGARLAACARARRESANEG